MKKKQRTLVIGDIHGAYRALLQCLERSEFDYKKDKLICLGDVVDGWSETVEAIEELLKIKNLIYIIGNHCTWARDWLKFGSTPSLWTMQGGQATLNSYLRLPDKDRLKVMKRHLNFFDRGVYYYVMDNKLFVHGGFNWHQPIEDTSNYDHTWDRNMWVTANYYAIYKNNKDNKMGDYDDIFIGHSTTSSYDKTLKPVHACNVWNLDQGAGYEGRLTIMDVYSKEYWQSEKVNTLYPEEKGR